MDSIKKVGILAIFFFILAFSVAAEINIDSFSRDTLNYGDKLEVSGSVKLNTDSRAFLSLNLICGDITKTLSTSFMDLKQNIPKTFAQLVSMPSIAGACKIQAKLTQNTETIETEDSDSFNITSDLKGSFNINVKESSQLGDLFSLQASIVRYDNTGVDGTAIINFKQNNNIVLFETAGISGGILEYQKDLSLIPSGAYSLDLNVQDNQGNFHYYSDIASFDVNDKIVISTQTNKLLYSPNETVQITGNVRSIVNSLLENIEIEGSIGEVKLKTFIPDAKFDFSLNYKIPANIKRGEHNIAITAKDDKGNYGTSTVKFDAKAIPTTLALSLNKASYIPEEGISFTPALLDQAGDAIDSSITIKLYDNNNQLVYSKSSATNNNDKIILPYMALPGNWKLKAEGFGLSSEKTLIALPYKKITAEISNGMIYIKNIGNVEYDEFLDVKTQDKAEGRKIKLNLNESTSIKLSDLFDTGNYNIDVPAANQNFSSVAVIRNPGIFEGIASMTGNAVANLQSNGSKPLLFVVFLGLIVALIFVLKPKKGMNNKYNENNRAHNYAAGQKKLAELRTKGIRKGPSMQFGKADEKDVADFRDRMAKQVQDEEARHTRESFTRRWSRDENKYYTSPKPSATSSSSSDNSSSGGGLINW